MKKQEYICKNPPIFVINLFFAKYVHKLLKKKKKKKKKIREPCVLEKVKFYLHENSIKKRKNNFAI